MDTGPAIRLATMHWHSASGYPTGPQMDPSGTPCPGAPGGARPGGPRGAREISRARGAPGAGAPGGPRGAQNGAPEDPQNGPFLGPIIILFVLKRGVQGGYPLGALCPGGPPGPRGAKKCTFFWVFNNSPSRDSFGPFFGTPPEGHFGGYPGQGLPYGGIGGSTPSSYRAIPWTLPSPCAACSTLPERLGSMAATGPASAPSALVGGT